MVFGAGTRRQRQVSQQQAILLPCPRRFQAADASSAMTSLSVYDEERRRNDDTAVSSGSATPAVQHKQHQQHACSSLLPLFAAETLAAACRSAGVPIRHVAGKIHDGVFVQRYMGSVLSFYFFVRQEVVPVSRFLCLDNTDGQRRVFPSFQAGTAAWPLLRSRCFEERGSNTTTYMDETF